MLVCGSVANNDLLQADVFACTAVTGDAYAVTAQRSVLPEHSSRICQLILAVSALIQKQKKKKGDTKK